MTIILKVIPKALERSIVGDQALALNEIVSYESLSQTQLLEILTTHQKRTNENCLV